MPDLNPSTQERFNARGRHLRFWRFVRPIAAAFARARFGFSHDDLGGIEPPYLLVCNHVTDLDPVFVGVAMRHQGYFVATENVLHKGFASRMLMRYLCPIIHQKGKMGLRSAQDMLKTLSRGVSVVLFPEGNRTFNGLTCEVSPVTAKLARKAGKLVCARLEGGYLTQPRWSTSMRRGRLHLRLVGVYDADALSAMTNGELQATIERNLYEDAFSRQDEIAGLEGRPVSFAGKHLALGMESALFVCPECGRIGTLTSNDDGICCGAEGCGFSSRFTPDGFLEGGRFRTIAEWGAWQRDELARVLEQAPTDEPVFSDTVTVDCYDDNHELASSVAGTLTAFADRVTFAADGSANAPVCVGREDIDGLAVFSRNTLIAHVGKPARHYEVRGALSFNALKYLYMLQLTSR